MKLFRNLFSLLKRHYEKVILTLALVGLIGAVWYLNEMKTEENGKIEKYEKETARRKSSPIPLVDMKELSTAMTHATNAPGLNFSPPHNLFNPVKWQQRPDRTRIKAETGRELGINAVQIVTNTPLHLIITLDAQAGSGAQMSTTMETNRLAQRIRSYVTTNSTSDRLHRSHAFTLRDFRITADGPEIGRAHV